MSLSASGTFIFALCFRVSYSCSLAIKALTPVYRESADNCHISHQVQQEIRAKVIKNLGHKKKKSKKSS